MSKATHTDAMGSIQRGVKRASDFTMAAPWINFAFAYICHYFCLDEMPRKWSCILSTNTHRI